MSVGAKVLDIVLLSRIQTPILNLIPLVNIVYVCSGKFNENEIKSLQTGHI